MTYTLYFDGCSKGNPGISGCGAVIYNSDNEEIWSIAEYIGDKYTNNYAEYCGLIRGLEEAIKLNIHVLVVKGDSQLVIRQMKGEYKVKANTLISLYHQATLLASKFEHIEYHHIYRCDNKRADSLSNLGLIKIDSKTI
jgi:ribonuclease HI